MMNFESVEQPEDTSANEKPDGSNVADGGVPIYSNDGQGNYLPTGTYIFGDVQFPTAHDYNILTDELRGATEHAADLERKNKVLEKKVLELEATNLSGSYKTFNTTQISHFPGIGNISQELQNAVKAAVKEYMDRNLEEFQRKIKLGS